MSCWEQTHLRIQLRIVFHEISFVFVVLLCLSLDELLTHCETVLLAVFKNLSWKKESAKSRDAPKLWVWPFPSRKHVQNVFSAFWAVAVAPDLAVKATVVCWPPDPGPRLAELRRVGAGRGSLSLEGPMVNWNMPVIISDHQWSYQYHPISKKNILRSGRAKTLFAQDLANDKTEAEEAAFWAKQK